jgi:hypothetical protein
MTHGGREVHALIEAARVRFAIEVQAELRDQETSWWAGVSPAWLTDDPGVDRVARN